MRNTSEKSFRTFSEIMCLISSFIKNNHTNIHIYLLIENHSQRVFMKKSRIHLLPLPSIFTFYGPKHTVIKNSQVLTYPICTAPASSPHQLHLCLTPKTKDSL